MTSNVILDSVLDFFPIDISSTQRVKINGLKPDTSIFKVDPYKSELIKEYSDVTKPYMGDSYIIDTNPGMKIACYPHIVGEELKKLSLGSANEFIIALKKMNLIENDFGIAHVLRAGPSYMVSDALQKEVPIFTVRPKYSEGAYQSHDDSKKIHIVYNDYTNKKMENVYTLIVPDTYATGVAGISAIKDMLENGLNPERVILYGFIAIPGLIKLGKLFSEKGIKLTSFSIGNITGLSRNNFDMPLCGVDDSWYYKTIKQNSEGEIRLMGSIVSKETLKRYLNLYIFGLDQPGDWSERQTILPNGKGYEKGNILDHIKNSIRNIKNLQWIYQKHFSEQLWYENFQKLSLIELNNLENELEKLNV